MKNPAGKPWLSELTLANLIFACNWWRMGSESDNLLSSRFLRSSEDRFAMYRVMGFCSQAVQDACDDSTDHEDYWWVTECRVTLNSVGNIVGTCLYENAVDYDNLADAVKAYRRR